MKHNEFLWETTGTIETKTTLSKYYPAIPYKVIVKAIDDGVRTFDELMKRWKQHEIDAAIRKAEAQRRSVVQMRKWTLGTNPNKRDYRDFR
jgi:hypothetical protein